MVSCAQVSPTPGIQARPGNDNILIRIDWIQVNGIVGDMVGNGELFVDMLVIRANGDSRQLQAPGNGSYKIGEIRKIKLDGYSLSVNGITSNETILLDIVAFDSDEIGFLQSQVASAALDGTLTLLEKHLEEAAFVAQMGSKATIVGFVISTAVGGVLDWWQEADVLGDYAVILEPSNNWMLGSPHVVTSSNGNITLSYTIMKDDVPSKEIIEVTNVVEVTKVVIVTEINQPATSTHQPANTPRQIPTNTSFSQGDSQGLSLEQFIRLYYDTINKKDYETSWNMLSDTFKADMHGPEKGGRQGYVDFWNTVDSVEIVDITIVKQDNNSATVHIKATYNYAYGATPSDRDHYFTFDKVKNTWLFGWE